MKGVDGLAGFNKGDSITLPSFNIRLINAGSYQLIETMRFFAFLTA
jgi:hypothetical protein